MVVVIRPRRVATSAVVVASALALSACGSAGPEPSGGESSGELSVWFPGTNQTEIDLVTEQIVPAFEEETGATVEVTFLDWGDMSTKLNAAFAGGTAPDVFGHGPAALADFVANERVEPLTEYVDRLSAEDQDDLADAMSGGQVNGTQFLIPLSLQGSLLVYNADDFVEAGLDPANPPATWEDVYDVASDLTVRDASGTIVRSGLLLPSQPIGRQQTFAFLLHSAGGQQLTDDGAEAAFASDEGQRALDYFTQLFSGSDAVSAGLGADYSNAPTAQQPLVLGTASITLLSPNSMQQVVTAYPELDLRVMMPPKFEGADDGHALGGAGPGLMINADSAEKDLAWQFIQYMISPDTGAEYTQGIGAIPARASAASTPYVQDNPVLQAFVEAAPLYVTNPNVPGWVQVRDTMDKYIEQALNETTSARDALDRAAADVDKILEANR
ncbi:ABC transporter substrate-binding protein [Jiangella endophytica]|uniref:ABC transporter substrate-binding protein n=1 Tax=Jiangella endophytica TaxID=1623398 RepID=UPI000E344F03|nr:ABC transporter substrate-binding protein [Jiangella endophytica]